MGESAKIIELDVTPSMSAGFLIDYLNKIGHINKDTNIKNLYSLLSHKSAEVRALAIKNIAKINDYNNVKLFQEIYATDNNSVVKREAISAIGRQRDKKNIDFLFGVLHDNDPKIVCQAIRALLVFKGDEYVDMQLKKLSRHKNEMVKQVIEKEFSRKQNINPIRPHKYVDTRIANVVVLGDVLDVLKTVNDESIHLTFTSPPYYNARDYSIYSSYNEYLELLKKVFNETYRVTKEGRFLIVNTSPIIIPRISRAHSSKRYPIPFDLHGILVKSGWEFIDDIIWEKPEYSVKNRIGGFQQHGKPLGYKPNNITEYLMVYRKKTDKLLDWNIHQYDNKTVDESKVKGEFEKTNVWRIQPKSNRVHSAIFPVELCKRVIEYYSYKGDIVFDPFAGSGTLGKTAKSLDRKFFLTEKEPKYFEYMKTMMSGKSPDINQVKFLTLAEFERTRGEN